MITLIDQRVEELETRVAFQDDLIEKLNMVITRQDREILEIKLQLATVAERLKEFGDNGSSAGESSDFEVPPHY